MKKIIGLFLLAGTLSASNSYAQEGYFGVQYTMGFGSGETKDFIDAASFRGVTLEYKKMVSPTMSVGADGGWNVFYEKRPYDTYTNGGSSLSGTQYRYQNMVPLYASFDYYLQDEDQPMRPYVGLGIGTLYSHKFLDMGLYEIEDESWHFALRPEAGVLVEANSSLSIMLVGRWNYAFETSDVAAQQFFTVNIGAAFLIW